MDKFLLLLLFPSIALCQAKEQWIDKPTNQWPSIAMVNDVLYKNGDRHQDPSIPYVGTGFLLNTGNDTFAITVKHALYAARNKATDKVVVNDQLAKWKMYPKNNTKDSVIIGRLVNEDSTEKLFSAENGILQRDWLVFTTTWISPNITPLKLSKSIVNVGDRVHMMSNPYNFENTLLVSGTVIKKLGEHLFVKFDGMDKQMLGGASGSPVVNDNGHLIGIFSNQKRNPKTGENTYIINNTDYLKQVLTNEKPLNVDRRSISVWLDSLIHEVPAKQALRHYTKLVDQPATADVYELHYINWGHMQKIGDSLLNANRTKDAIQFLEYFTKSYPELSGFYVLLAKAHRQNNNDKKAIAVLERALTETFEEDKADLKKLLDEFKGQN